MVPLAVLSTKGSELSSVGSVFADSAATSAFLVKYDYLIVSTLDLKSSSFSNSTPSAKEASFSF